MNHRRQVFISTKFFLVNSPPNPSPQGEERKSRFSSAKTPGRPLHKLHFPSRTQSVSSTRCRTTAYRTMFRFASEKLPFVNADDEKWFADEDLCKYPDRVTSEEFPLPRRLRGQREIFSVVEKQTPVKPKKKRKIRERHKFFSPLRPGRCFFLPFSAI